MPRDPLTEARDEGLIVTRTVKLSLADDAALRAYAEAQGVSLSIAIRAAVKTYLAAARDAEMLADMQASRKRKREGREQ